MSAPSSPAPSGDDWQVEPPLPADRGLVARLLEDCVRTDPALAALAPGVADGSQRAGAWLARTRPAWSGVVVDPDHSPRRLLGYADVLADPRHRLRLVLLAPTAAGTPVDDLLRAAAASAVAELDSAAVGPADGTAAGTAPGLFPEADELPATRFAPVVLVRRRPVAAAVGAAAIALGGVAAVLAVQVGVGPLGGVLPFLAPEAPAATSSVDPGPAADDPDGPEDPAVPVPAQPVIAAGAPIAPLPGPPPATAPGDVGTGPGGPASPPPGPPPAPPGDQPGLTSSLLDPVVGTVVTVVDGATADTLEPVTSLVEGTADGATDLLDQTVDQVLGLLPRPRR
jgi:hypothetical protein